MVFVLVNVVLLIIWNVVDPLQAVPIFTGQEVFYILMNLHCGKHIFTQPWTNGPILKISSTSPN